MKNGKNAKRIIFFLLIAFAIVLFLLSPLFSIQKIVVSGTSFYNEDDVKKVYEDLIGKNGFCTVFKESSFSHIDKIFHLELYNRTETLIFEKPYVKTAKASYQFPNVLSIEISERSPAFLTIYEGVYLLIDSEGVVLETFTEDNKPSYPIIQGLSITSFKIGTSLNFSAEKEHLLTAIQIYNLMQQTNMETGYVDAIDIENINEIWMSAYPSLSIKLGDRVDLGLKISKLKGIMDSGYDGDSDGIIDFTSSKNPIFRENIKTTDDLEHNTDSPIDTGDRDSNN